MGDRDIQEAYWLGSLSQTVSLKFSEREYLKNGKESIEEDTPVSSSDLHMDLGMVSTPMLTHVHPLCLRVSITAIKQMTKKKKNKLGR